jgi:hypothetical protein
MHRLMAVLLVAMSVGCASRPSNLGVINQTRNMGNATAAETYEKTSLVLTMHQFEIEHESGPPSMYFQTRWRDRAPFEDEIAIGINGARIRATVTARKRSQTSLMGEFYAVDLVIEQRVRFINANIWVQDPPPTASAREYAEQIAADLRRELDIGVRRH